MVCSRTTLMAVWVLLSSALDCRRNKEEIWLRWHDNNCSWAADGHHGRPKGANSECGFTSSSLALWQEPTGNAAKNVWRHSCKDVVFFVSIHKEKLFSKKLKTPSNYHVSPPQLHFQRDYCLLFSARRHGYTKKTDVLCCHAYSWKCFGQSGHWQELHQRQPREEGHIWSFVTPVSHFLL